MCQSILINTISFLFCEFIRVTSWNDGKTIIFVRSSSQIPKEKYWFHIQGKPMQCKHVFPNCKCEGNFSTYVFGKSF